MLHRALAADAAAVGVLLVTRAHALNHHHPLPFAHFLGIGVNLGIQFQLGHHPRVVAVQMLLGLVFIGAGGNDSDTVLDQLLSLVGSNGHGGGEVALVTFEVGYLTFGQHGDLLMGADIGNEPLDVGLYFQPFNGMGDLPGQATQFLALSTRTASNPCWARLRAALRPAMPPPITRPRC